jgi:hypothetical protein
LVSAGWTSRHLVRADGGSAGAAAVPAHRTWPRHARMPGVGATPCEAARADIANRNHRVAVLRAGRHDYSPAARRSRATAATTSTGCSSWMYCPRARHGVGNEVLQPLAKQLTLIVQDLRRVLNRADRAVHGPASNLRVRTWRSMRPLGSGQAGAAVLRTSDPVPPLGPLQLPCRAPPGAKAGETAIRGGDDRCRQRHREESKEECLGHGFATFGGGNRLSAEVRGGYAKPSARYAE